jgi:hypothetical protein
MPMLSQRCCVWRALGPEEGRNVGIVGPMLRLDREVWLRLLAAGTGAAPNLLLSRLPVAFGDLVFDVEFEFECERYRILLVAIARQLGEPRDLMSYVVDELPD